MVQQFLLQICECLLDQCLAPDCRMGGVGCDNMTVILVCFLHGSTFAELAERCSYPVPEQSKEKDLSKQVLVPGDGEESTLATYQQEPGPMDLRGVAKGVSGIVMDSMHHQLDGSDTSCHGNEPQQLSCTV